MPEGSWTTTRRALLVALVLVSACAHAPRREVTSSAAALRCEDASFFLAHQPPPSAGDQARRAAMAPLSYVATGTGAVGAAAVLTAGGVAVGAIVCSPFIALDAALGGHGDMGGQCVGDVASPLIAIGTVGAGRVIYRATRTWRCLDRSRESRETRAVARCHAKRRWPGDLDVARALLVGLQVHGCVPDGERRAIEAALSEMPGDDAAAPEPERGPPDAPDSLLHAR